MMFEKNLENNERRGVEIIVQKLQS